ncbi:MAG TPA: hypothetical protein VK308_13750 [Pyrinomonadaceae bacterium]|nr:hypothetical protein [Pyrinomonadaceae bacterium]
MFSLEQSRGYRGRNCINEHSVYRNGREKARIGTLAALMMPYTVAFFVGGHSF